MRSPQCVIQPVLRTGRRVACKGRLLTVHVRLAYYDCASSGSATLGHRLMIWHSLVILPAPVLARTMWMAQGALELAAERRRLAGRVQRPLRGKGSRHIAAGPEIHDAVHPRTCKTRR